MTDPISSGSLFPDKIDLYPAHPTERLLLGLLSDASQQMDDLTNRSGLPASTVSAVLTMMELKGLVQAPRWSAARCALGNSREASRLAESQE